MVSVLSARDQVTFHYLFKSYSDVNSILIEAQYFPPVSYFSLIQSFESVTVEKFEHYRKQTYRNRCYINTSQGPQALIVPVIHREGKAPVRDIRIDHSQKWLNNHCRTIRSAYGKAPFHEYYSDGFQALLFKKHEFLYDLNLEILTMCLTNLGCNIPVRETTSYEKEPGIGIKDYRSVLNPKKEDGSNRFFNSVRYQQVFGSKFVGNLSILDLIFCEGPRALNIVRGSAGMNK